MSLRYFKVILILILVLVLASCSRNGPVNLSGVVQKGVFIDLSVKAFPIDNAGVLGSAIETTSEDSSFEITLPRAGFYQIEATGTFINEISGEEVTLAEPLRSIVELTDIEEISNINLLTDLQAKQTIVRVSDGTDLPDAVDESSLFVQQTFNLEATNFSLLDTGQVTTESTLNDPNLQLVLISGAALQAADKNSTGSLVFSPEISSFGSFTSTPIAVGALANLAGTSAINIYQTVQPNIPGLPENIPELGNGNIVFICDVISCSWQQTNGRTLSLMGSGLLESKGHVQLAIELSSESPNDIEVVLTSYETATTLYSSATDGIDMVPVSKVITIPAGTTRFPVEVQILLDTLVDDKEKYRYELSPIGGAYSLLVAERTITILDGFGEAATGLNDQVKLDSICLSALGDGFFIQSNGCLDVDNDILAIPQVDSAALAIDLSLEAICDTRANPTCKAGRRDWLVELSLEALSLQNGLEAQQIIGNYFVSGERLIRRGDKSEIETAYVHLDDSAKQLISQAKTNNWTWSIRGRLVETDQADNDIGQIIPDVIELPEQISAADLLVDYRITDITQTDNCSGDNYLIRGFFSLDGITFNEGLICVKLEQGGANSQTVAVLQAPYGIHLAGNKIQLPAFHSAHIVYGDQRIQVLGADYFYVPEDPYSPSSNGEQNEERRLCDAIGCDRGQQREEETEPETLSLYLHSDGWPFAFGVDRGLLYSDGIKLDFNKMKYIHAGEYSSNDPRSYGQIISNDIIYSSINNNPSGQLLMTSTGFDVFNIRDNVAGQGEYAFPKTNITWPSFNLSLTNSQINSMTLPMDIELKQSTQCIGCRESALISHKMSGNVIMNAEGNSLGNLTIAAGNGSIPSWGNISGQAAFSRDTDLVDGESAVLALPGFLFSDLDLNNNVAGLDILLKGHVEQRGSTLVLNSTLSDSAIDGNFWPSGITVGPELYYDNSAVPSEGSGRLLNGLNLSFSNGINSYSKPVNIGAKYVIRNAGVTGVFNLDIDPTIGEKMPFYDYDMTFSRFAFRQTNNALEKYTWIDGFIHLPGKNEPLPGPGNANFDVDFVSLGLGCDAKLFGGTLEYCDSDSCKKRLEAWKADTDLTNMSWANELGESKQCVAEVQELALEQTVNMNALDLPLGLVDVVWTPSGNVKKSKFATFQDVILDAKTDQNLPGFHFSPNQGGLKLLSSPANYGVVELNDSTMVTDTIWKAINADIRLSNTDTAAENSLVVAPGKLNDIADNTNDAIALDLTDPDRLGANFSPRANYTWADKLDFSLPIYYSTGDNNTQSSFFGRYYETDLIVMNAGAGVNYITPKVTYLSFGASANIESVINLPMQIDITNLASLSAMDNVLNNIGINLSLEQTFTVTNPLQPLMNDILASANNGIDRIFEQGIDEVLNQAANGDVNLWLEIAEPLAILQSLPQQIDAIVSEDVVLNFETEVLTPVSRLNATLSRLAETITSQVYYDRPIVGTDYFGQSMKDYILDQINAAKGIASEAKKPVDDLIEKINRVNDQLSSVTQDISQQVLRLNTALDLIDGSNGVLNQAVDFTACNGLDIQTITLTQVEESSPVIRPGIKQAKNVNDALTAIINILDVADILSPIFVGENDIEQRFRRQLNDLVAQAELLQIQWSVSVEGLAGEICAAEPEQYVADAKATIQLIRDNISAIVSAIDELGNANQISSFINQQVDMLTQLSSSINGIEQTMVEQAELLDNLDSEMTGGEFSDQLLTSIRTKIASAFVDTQLVDVFVNDLIGDQLGGEFTGDLNRKYNLSTGLILPIRTKILEFQQVFRSMLNFDISIPGANLSADDLKKMMVDSILDSDAITTQRNSINQNLQSYINELTDFQFGVSDQLNIAIKAKLQAEFSEVAALLEEAKADLNLPIKAFDMDGYALIGGKTLDQIHIDVSWETPSTAKDVEGNKFKAWLDAKRYVAGDNTSSCGASPGVEAFDVNIGAQTDIEFGESEAEVTVNLGFTFNEGDGASAFLPVGINGGLDLQGQIKQEPFILNDFGFVAGIGLDEVYAGAGGSGTFENNDFELYAFAGRTCNSNLIIENDAPIADLLKQKFVPGQLFTGLYARGVAPIPIVVGGCALDVIAQANVGGWLTVEPSWELGGILGGGIKGRLLCVGAARGRLVMTGSANSNDELFFNGDAFMAVGAGFDCDPGDWKTRNASRSDDWCGTGDIKIGLEYINEEWDYDIDFPSAFH